MSKREAESLAGPDTQPHERLEAVADADHRTTVGRCDGEVVTENVIEFGREQASGTEGVRIRKPSGNHNHVTVRKPRPDVEQ